MLNRRDLILAILAGSAGLAQASGTFLVHILNDGVDGDVTVWVNDKGAMTQIFPGEKESPTMKQGDERHVTVSGTPKKYFEWKHEAGGKTNTGNGTYGDQDTIPVRSAF